MERKPTYEELEQRVKELEKELFAFKRIEMELRESEGKYRGIFDESIAAVYLFDDKKNFLDSNQAGLDLLGYSREELLNMSIPDVDADPIVVLPAHEQLLGGERIINYEHRLKRKDGKVITVLNNSRPITDTDGHVIGMQSTLIDITERKQAVENLEKEFRMRTILLDNIPGCIALILKKGTREIVASNRLAQELGAVPGQTCFKTCTNRDDSCPFCLAPTLWKTGQSQRLEVEYRETWYEVIWAPFSEDLYVHYIFDITERVQAEEERKKLQEQLLQSKKMEAIGSLAGGIAHEFNNILTTIIGNTELAIGDVPESNPARECLEEIQSASLRAKDAVRQLLGFARKSVFQLQTVHLSPVIREAIILIRASTPATIEIRQNLSCESDTVMADPSQINLMLLNMCTNAKNAMQEEGGVLEVKLENTTIDEKSAASYEGFGPGNYVKMTVKDTGHGIDPKIIDRIFEPYFTTSSLAEATGMGLAVVHGIVKRHNGAIIVKSEPGKGTVFEVLFPLTKTEKPEVLPAGAERILFVDDEKSLVKMAKRWLEIQGYRVEAKSDPVEALELFRSKPDRFDLIITDMTMPKMTGDRLAKEILSIRPDMPIILCSGFSEKIDAEKAKELGIRKYIEKPLNMSDFVVAVRKVMDEAKASAQE